MQENNKNWTTRMLTEGAICIALSFILGLIKLFTLPQQGSVTAGQMIPLIIFAMRYGLGKGFVVGALYGLINMMLGGGIYHPVQAILDYPLAFGLLGLAGIYSVEFQETKSIAPILKGASIGIIARLICHVLSGVVFFKDYTPDGMNPWIYSITYNGSFLLVEFIITVLIIYLLRNFLTRSLPEIEKS